MTKLEILNKHIYFSKDGVIDRTDALQAMQEYADQQLILHGVVSSKTIHSKLANKHESLKGELNTITNIINGNKGMSNDYILDKTRNIPFLRCKLNLIEEMLGN